ncbi:hypothetical protein IWQ62_003580 [Dispira parvispora]|uniref:Protein kinase domain-containing protein n=1 Tax=Dispira parvispora TaxID=1520584 RepID=A0A9W8ATX1_9FUNG|nr:hypothetical protein IWQ62_003580 [Dispira parvispora]
MKYLGRGSYGTVSLAQDANTNQKYAIKEFSKQRLRKLEQAQSPFGGGWARGRGQGRGRPMRGWGSRRGGAGMARANSGDDRSSQSSTATATEGGSLNQIKREVAIFKKLRHPNIIRLYEVINDPNHDGLYMVYELCEKGALIDIRLHQAVEPCPEAEARGFFRQALLGIEYLHYTGIIHRDIKPDNLLLDHTGQLKIVDFGISEMFEKTSDMIKKSAGSPAFMAPELCHPNHGEVSGTLADIWSLGVTLYCLVVGQLPFQGDSAPAIYEAILNDRLVIPDIGLSDSLRDLLTKMLDKDPSTRATISAIRVHPWVTNDGEWPLPSVDVNCEHIVTEVTEQEISSAITTLSGVATVVKAVQRFKALRSRRTDQGSEASTTSTSTSSTNEV